MMHISMAVVSGRGPFPMDMLRVENAWPADSSAVDQITESLRFQQYSASWTIKLYRSGPTKTNAREWTKDRWNSFGWGCEVTSR